MLHYIDSPPTMSPYKIGSICDCNWWQDALSFSIQMQLYKLSQLPYLSKLTLPSSKALIIQPGRESKPEAERNLAELLLSLRTH